MRKNIHTYILLKLLVLKNNFLFFNYLSFIHNIKYFNISWILAITSNLVVFNMNKRFNVRILDNLLPLELSIKNAVITEKPIYFLPIEENISDAKLINIYLNNFKPLTDVELLLNSRKFRNVKRSITASYNPSLLICINSLKNFKVMSNIKTLGIPIVGLVDKTTVVSPFEISIYVPEINHYFQFYYFFLIFKLIVYYKKLYIRYLINNYTNFKLIYLRKLWLLK